MQTTCQKCGNPLTADQAFCSRCGAVVGMSDAAQGGGEEWNMAATMVGKKLPTTPARSSAAAPQPARENPPAYRADEYSPAQQQPARGGNTVLLAVIGFVAVLIIGGLLILLLYLNSRS